MAVYWLEPGDDFPSESFMEADGPIAVSRDLVYGQLKRAYSCGIFPWYNEGELVQWFCPDPRFVLFPEEIIISKSMRQVMRSARFSFSRNQAFDAVVDCCAHSPRKEGPGTWLTTELKHNLSLLNQEGWAESVEVWEKGELVGGLYGIRRGEVFMGESMFSRVSNASKAGLIFLAGQAVLDGITIIDCQVQSDHLASLGARLISRQEFLDFFGQRG